MTYRNKLFVADTPERKTQKSLVAKNIKDDTASSRLGSRIPELRSVALCEPSEAWHSGRKAQWLGSSFMEPQSIKLLAPGGLDSRIPEAPLCCALRAKRGLAFSFCPKPFGFEVFGHEALNRKLFVAAAPPVR